MADSTFPVLPIHKFSGSNAQVRRPTEITRFSYDAAHQLHHDASSLRTYYPPALDTSLSRGFDTFIKHDDNIDEHLDGLLAALVQLEKRTGEVVKADVVTWRGMMTKFMALPFDLGNGFEMNAVLFQDTVFIEENHTYKLATRARPDHRQEVMSFWGYKFETLATLPTNWDDCSREMIESRDEEVVSNEAQFCSIVKTGFDDIRVILGGEVDAVWNTNPPTPPTPPIYVELKTAKTPTSHRDDVAFERKLLRFWAQSFLLGVPKVVVGFRDDDGVLRSVREFETAGLPALAKRGGRAPWDAKLCVGFAAEVLRWIVRVVKGAAEDIVWRVRWRPGAEVVECVRTAEEGFLLGAFVEWREGRGEVV